MPRQNTSTIDTDQARSLADEWDAARDLADQDYRQNRATARAIRTADRENLTERYFALMGLGSNRKAAR